MGNNQKIKKIASTTKNKYGVQVNFSDGTGYWDEGSRLSAYKAIDEAKRHINCSIQKHGQLSNTTKTIAQKRSKKK